MELFIVDGEVNVDFICIKHEMINLLIETGKLLGYS